MTVRAALLAVSLLAVAGCSKTEEAQQQAPTPVAAAPAETLAPVVLESGRITQDGQLFKSPAEETAQRERESQLEMRAAAAEARARLAEIENQDRMRQQLERQELAIRAEAARAAVLAEQSRALDAENAALRARAYENEQRAVEAERAAYGNFGGSNVIIVQPPQRPRPRPPQYNPPQYPAPQPGHEPPPKGAGISVGLNRPAAPDLTPPGPPATFGGPKFDSMRARKPRDTEAQGETP